MCACVGMFMRHYTTWIKRPDALVSCCLFIRLSWETTTRSFTSLKPPLPSLPSWEPKVEEEEEAREEKRNIRRKQKQKEAPKRLQESWRMGMVCAGHGRSLSWLGEATLCLLFDFTCYFMWKNMLFKKKTELTYAIKLWNKETFSFSHLALKFLPCVCF